MAQASPHPSISIIVPTRNRAASLARTLDVLAQVELAEQVAVELIVADNGSTDDTRKTVEAFAAVAPFPVVYVHEPHPGVSRTRNAGIARATGALLMFTDDDCLVAPDWVSSALRSFDGDLLQLVGGRVALFDERHLPLAVKDAADPGRLTEVADLVGFVHSANLAMGRAVIDRIGAFDVRLGAPRFSAEDTDIVYRALRAGIPVRYDPAMRIRHDHGRVGADQWYGQNRAYARGCGAMMVKHLLAGRTDLIRMNYWDVRSALRKWRADPAEWRWVWAKTGIATGAVRFLYEASWRRSA